ARAVSSLLARALHHVPDNEWVPWGTMRIETPPRPVRAVGALSRGWRAAEEGVAPRYPHRLLSDGRVFARRRRTTGGAVVIDASGSMALNAKDILRIVEHAPGATVAAYAARTDSGALRILARKGRSASARDCSLAELGHMNVID